MRTVLSWCAYTARGISTNYTHLICCRAVSVSGQHGRCINSMVKPANSDNPLKMRCLCLDCWFTVTIEIDTGLTGPYSATQWGVNALPCGADHRTASWVPDRIDRAAFAKRCLLSTKTKAIAVSRFCEKKVSCEGVTKVLRKILYSWIPCRHNSQNICGVRQCGRGASTSGNYSTANDTWNSSVYKRCHASPWRRIVASWRLFIVTSS